MELEDRFPEEAAEAAWAAQEVEPYPDDGNYPEAPISPEFRQRLIAAVERPLRVRRQILLLAAHACGHLCAPDHGCRTCHRNWPCEDVRRAAAPALEAFVDTADDPLADVVAALDGCDPREFPVGLPTTDEPTTRAAETLRARMESGSQRTGRPWAVDQGSVSRPYRQRAASEGRAMSGATVGGVDRSAVLSEDGLYRYSLVREFPPLDPTADRGRVCWDLCNPSTADAMVDDPTVRKGIGFALRWGYSSIEFVNRAAFRATNPKHLLTTADPIGPENDYYVGQAFFRADLLIFAWGKAWPTKLDHLSPPPNWPTAVCLGRNGDGSPRHPLMLAYSTPLEPFAAASPTPDERPAKDEQR